MKAGWRLVPLSEVAAVGAGNPAPQDKADFQGGAFPFIRTSDVGQIRFGEISTSADMVNEKCAKKLRLVPKGTVLFPKSGASTFLNHRVITTVDAYVSSHLATITAKPKLLDSRFLLYALSRVRAQELLPENSYPSLNLSLLNSATIPLPPLDEQKRIVAVLDEALEGLSRARANAQANLADAQELFAAAHKGALARHSGAKRKVTMADVADIASTLVDPKLPEFSSLPHVGAGNMPTCSDQLLGVQTAAEEGLTSGKFLFDQRMVLYSKIRPYLRKASRPDFDGLCSADVYPLLPRAGVIERDYLFYVLLGPEFTDYAIIGSARAGMPKVNREHLFKYTFELPDLGRQREIADLLDEALAQARTLEDAYSSKLDAIESLRQSVLQRAFSGELTSAKPVASTGNADLDAVLDELFLADAADVAPKSDPDAARRVKRIREILSDEWNGE